MKPHQVTTFVSGLVFVGLIAALGMRQRQIGALQIGATGQAPVQDVAPVTRPAPAEVPLTDSELRDLLSLRRDVARLRQDKSKLEALQAENTRLRTAITNAATSEAKRVAVPEGYLIANRAQFVGFATPQDALQSFLWSIRNRDTNALFQVLTPASATMLAEVIARQGPDDFFKGASKMPGFLIRSVQENGDGKAFAEIQIDPHNPSRVEKFRLEHDDKGMWRLEM
ncbi:MAG TPA: hypothetical protein PLX89_09320 [Verrucomicrobiota bacterium]|nr:hypothetical protein [Verrucomicrobiales bacterium]HRI13194.1 hypothetical protein [Verrucomicrobiota bacterium]